MWDRLLTGGRDDAEPPQPADPAIPLCLHLTPVARGRCCGTLVARAMRKGLTIVLGLLLLLAGSMFVWRARVQRQVADARSFCESLLPAIQQARSGSGSYPTNADIQWWAGRPVPALILTQSLYYSDGKIFVLSFRDPSAFWDDIWAFDSRWMKWLNYD
jgi:hypothetical protein